MKGLFLFFPGYLFLLTSSFFIKETSFKVYWKTEALINWPRFHRSVALLAIYYINLKSCHSLNGVIHCKSSPQQIDHWMAMRGKQDRKKDICGDQSIWMFSFNYRAIMSNIYFTHKILVCWWPVLERQCVGFITCWGKMHVFVIAQHTEWVTHRGLMKRVSHSEPQKSTSQLELITLVVICSLAAGI